MVKMLSKQFVDFTSGLNLVDSELNMNPSYLTEARNIEIGYDSSIKKRNGFQCNVNLADSLEEDEIIQQIFYFSGFVWCYTNQGRILCVDEDGNAYIVWDYFEACMRRTQALTPVNIWNNPTKRCFGNAFGKQFILSNGYDKPLDINLDLVTREVIECEISVASGIVTVENGVDLSGIVYNPELPGEKYLYAGTIAFVTSNDFWYGKINNITGQVITMDVWYGDTDGSTHTPRAMPDGTYNVEIVWGSGCVNYLVDPSNGSNANVPYIYKCATVNHYLCAICKAVWDGAEFSNIPDNKIYFSAKNAAGLWDDHSGDSDSNGWRAAGGADAIDISNVVAMDNQELLDIDSFRGELIAFTNYAFVMYRLDTYKVVGTKDIPGSGDKNDKVENIERHIPEIDTVVENAGVIATGSLRSIFDSSAFLSMNGLNSVKRNVVSQNFIPESLSAKVLPIITKNLGNMTDGMTAFVDYRKFTYGIRLNDTEVLVMSFHPNFGNKKSFVVWDNVRYISFTNNAYGKILATDGYGIFSYTNDEDNVRADDYIIDGEIVTETFNMVMQTPWIMYGESANVKSMEYINVVADGTAKFTLSAAFDLRDDTEIDIDMLGGDRYGYGSSNPYYGGGIIASNLNLIDFNQTFMYNQFKIESSDDLPLRVVRINVQYKIGGIRR